MYFYENFSEFFYNNYSERCDYDEDPFLRIEACCLEVCLEEWDFGCHVE